MSSLEGLPMLFRLILGAAFLFAAGAKLLDMRSFAEAVRTTIRHEVDTRALVVFPVAEFVLGAWILLGAFKTPAATAAAIFLTSASAVLLASPRRRTVWKQADSAFLLAASAGLLTYGHY